MFLFEFKEITLVESVHTLRKSKTGGNSTFKNNDIDIHMHIYILTDVVVKIFGNGSPRNSKCEDPVKT